jgi:c-di-GMP-binding flagellar brake protein YcgR
MKEKRKFTRFETKDASSLETKTGKQKTLLVDISLGGMHILLDNEIKAGDPISGEFTIKPNAKPFYVTGEVAWVKPQSDKLKKGNFQAGIKFTHVSTLPPVTS